MINIEEWKRSNQKLSEVYHNVNNPEIPVEDRIYSSDRMHWCKKTTTKEAENFFKALDKMHKEAKIRGIKYAPVTLDDKVVNGKLTIANTDRTIDILYVYDENQHKYRMITDELKYGLWQEIVFDKKTQCFTIKNLDKLRAEWRKIHPEDVIDDNVLDMFIEMEV